MSRLGHMCRRSLWDGYQACFICWVVFRAIKVGFVGEGGKTFGFERKTHFKGLFENLDYPNFSDNILPFLRLNQEIVCI